MNARQRKFAELYAQSGNASWSAVQAGYSEKFVNTNAVKLLQNTTIQQYIKWYGDETVTTAYSVTSDFYSHWGLTKSDVYGSSAAKATKKVTLIIDGKTYIGELTEM